MKTKLVLIGVLIVSHVAFFVLGGIVNRHMMLNAFATEVKNANAAVDLGLYLEYRDIALAITAKEYENALCAAQLGASGRYDDLKTCLADQRCRFTVEQHLKDRAPEILGEAPLKFAYIEARNGVRPCAQRSMPSRPAK